MPPWSQFMACGLFDLDGFFHLSKSLVAFPITFAPAHLMTWLVFAIWSVTTLLLEHVSDDFRSDLMYPVGHFWHFLMFLESRDEFSARFANIFCFTVMAWNLIHDTKGTFVFHVVFGMAMCNVAALKLLCYVFFFNTLDTLSESPFTYGITILPLH